MRLKISLDILNESIFIRFSLDNLTKINEA